MKLIFYTATCSGNRNNCNYPTLRVVESADQMKEVISRDHVCGEFADGRRSTSNFIKSSVVVMDCDNDHSDTECEWITPEKMHEYLPDTSYVLVASRNNWKEKGTKTPRPRFHVYFPVQEIRDAKKYSELKRAIYTQFPFFDGNALDAARFIFGSETDEIIWHTGQKSIDTWISEKEKEKNAKLDVIPEGERNSTLHKYATQVVKRYGASEEAYKLFLNKAASCTIPLPESELNTIWNSAVKYYEKEVRNQVGYIPPDEFNLGKPPGFLKPTDYSDIGQAKKYVETFGDTVKYTTATDFLVYKGDYWHESKQQAIGVMERFLDLQLRDALDLVNDTLKEMTECGISPEIATSKSAKVKEALSPDQTDACNKYLEALSYLNFVHSRRDMKYIFSALQAAKPMLEIQPADLDSDGFLLNTPNETYYLPDGLSGSREKSAANYVTKQTIVSPGDKGKKLWNDALNLFFCGDQNLIDYVQTVVGLSCIGKVYMEALIIAFGGGRNGKSTFWNSISRVLGTYSGGISADVLTVGCKRSVQPEKAELKGKRLVIAAELDEGMRLNTSVIKQLCSTDAIYAEKKYKDPFSFIPSHTIVLYTNHLPKVGAIDEGTWRRLIVIPFNAQIEGKGDIKNYADHLVEDAGPSILSWIIEGAKRVISNKFHLDPPECVINAIRSYRENNDWLGAFLEECCDLDPSYTQKSGEFYMEYRAFCTKTGDYIRSTTDFYAALESTGYKRKKTRDGMLVWGLRLRKKDNLVNE